MRPASARFLRAVQSSHRMCVDARVCPPGRTGVDPAGTVVPIVSGAVTLDANADIRASLDLTTTAAWPSSAADPLTPYGNEIFVRRGIVYGDGSREWVSQGYYRIYSVEQDNAPHGPIQVSGKDRMSGIIDARLLAPVQFTAGTTILSVIQTLVFDVYPWAVIDYDPSLAAATLASDQTTTDDRYTFLHDLVTSFGMVMYWNYKGYLSVHPAPNPTTPVVTVAAGPGGVLTKLSRSLTRDGIYNAYVATGEQAADTPPVSAVVVDTDSHSPTYFYGGFGQVPAFFSSSFLTTPQQCASAAASLLQQSIGLPYEVDYSMIPNPALEPLDCQLFAYPGRREIHVSTSLTIPLDAATAMTGTTRQLVTGTLA